MSMHHDVAHAALPPPHSPRPQHQPESTPENNPFGRRPPPVEQACNRAPRGCLQPGMHALDRIV
jgi:hypothetical protein